MLARHSIHAIQKEAEVLKSGRPKYAHDPDGLIAAKSRDCGRVRHHRRSQQLLALERVRFDSDHRRRDHAGRNCFAF
jgi:hypothetical protein